MGSGADALDEAIARIEEIKANQGKKGCTTGIVDIDDLLGGFEPGQVIVVAGRPGMGKTAVACSSVIGLARGGSGVLFLSLEMRSKELGMRMAADLCFEGNRGVDFAKIVNGTVSSDDMMRICRARDEISSWPIAIVDHGSVTLSRLQLGVRRAKRRFAAKGHELKVVVIDYLQLLNVDTPGRKSQYEVVSEISRTLKAMAKDLNVCIIALAQLSREVEKRDDKRPQLSDLRDSGQIEQDADAVMFLYREEYYLTKKKPPKTEEARINFEKSLADSRSRIEFLVPKCRNGPGGDRQGYYFAHFQAVRGSDNYGERML
jgi:replicative DNA helicase